MKQHIDGTIEHMKKGPAEIAKILLATAAAGVVAFLAAVSSNAIGEGTHHHRGHYSTHQVEKAKKARHGHTAKDARAARRARERKILANEEAAWARSER